MLSLSEENYLKTIYHLEQSVGEVVSTNAIAEKLHSKPSSVTDMVQKLAEKGLLSYIKYKGTSLSPEGRRIAITIVRKHRLWEVFLLEKLEFAWDEVHAVAEQLEHIQSKKLIEQLDAYLGFPKVDPHGDPIPDAQGNIKKVEKRLLSNLTVGTEGICIGVRESNSEFLKYLDKKSIGIGTEIKIITKEDFDQSMVIEVAKKSHFISKTIAENIYVQV